MLSKKYKSILDSLTILEAMRLVQIYIILEYIVLTIKKDEVTDLPVPIDRLMISLDETLFYRPILHQHTSVSRSCEIAM